MLPMRNLPILGVVLAVVGLAVYSLIALVAWLLRVM